MSKDNAVILGLDPAKCDTFYPRTLDGRCHGCGVVGDHPKSTNKHQWVSPGGLRVYRVCCQCGKEIPVSRDVDPVAMMAVDDCPVGVVPIHYCIEPGHLEQIRSFVKRLYTEQRMNGDEMRDAAHTLMSIVRYAESLDALRGPGEPYIHMLTKEE